MRLCLSLFFIFTSLLTLAQTTNPTNGNTNNQSKILSLSGLSSYSGLLAGDINTPTTVIYGGVAGGLTGGCASPSASSTCDNCKDSNGLTACNTTRVHDDLLLTIQFKPETSGASQGEIGGKAFVTGAVVPPGAGSVVLDVVSQSPAGNINPLNVAAVSVQVRWSDICEKIFGSTTNDCNAANFETTGTQGLRLGIDVDNDAQFDDAAVTELQIAVVDFDADSVGLCTEDSSSFNGVCNFTAYPGDEKVYIENLRTDCSFPSVGDTQATSLRVFYNELSSATTPTALSETSVDLPIGSASSATCSGSQEFSLSDNEVKGLKNGTSYRFSVGLLDKANNLGGVLDLSSVSDVATDNSTCFTPSDAYPQNCHVATPEEVLSLIEKEFDCFITTATYGTPFRPKVEDFRAFRNQYLHTTWLGRKIIKFYYRHSPPVADWIRNHPQSKPIVRVLLWPLWAFAKLCLQYPLALLFGLFTILAVIFARPLLRKGELS